MCDLSYVSRIIGFGGYVPERILTNADLENMVDTNDEWITQRTGIKERRIAAENQFSSDLAIAAVEDLIARQGVNVSDVDQIIVTTFTPDHFTPTVSALVQGHFGMQNAGTYDLAAGCTGFAYAVSVADALVVSGANKKVLVVAAERVSQAVDYTDRSSCILFGDGAAACIVERCAEGDPESQSAILARYFHTDGDLAHHVTCTNYSHTVNGVEQERVRIFDQNGQQVYKYVMKQIPEGIRALLSEISLELDDIDWFVPHSANMRMIQTVCEKLPFPERATLTSLEYYGNTSSASIPLSLWLAQKEGRLQRGDTAILYGFGGGLTHGGVIVRL